MNVIITGGSRGIGKAIAIEYAERGHHLFLCSRNEEALTKTATELRKKFPSIKVMARPADLGEKNEAIDFGEWCLAFGKPDILVNNAGHFSPGSVYNEEDGNLEQLINTNLYSAYHLTRTILPSMMERKSGHIFNICSIAALHAYANGGAYSISKFALLGFSRNLREEMKPFGIKVTAVMPGAVMTDSWQGFDNSTRRIMEAKDIATLIFTASQLSPQACVEDITVRPVLGDL